MTRSKQFPTNDRLDQKIISLTREEEEAINFTNSLYIYQVHFKGTTLYNATKKTTYNGGCEIVAQFTTTKKLNHSVQEIQAMFKNEQYIMYITKVDCEPAEGDSFTFNSLNCYMIGGTIVTVDVATNDHYTMPANDCTISYIEVKHS